MELESKQEESTTQYIKQLMDFQARMREEDRRHELELMKIMMIGMQASMQQMAGGTYRSVPFQAQPQMPGEMYGGMPFQPQPFQYAPPTSSADRTGQAFEVPHPLYPSCPHSPWSPEDPKSNSPEDQ